MECATNNEASNSSSNTDLLCDQSLSSITDISQSASSTSSSINQSISITTNLYSCSVCTQSFREQSALKMHHRHLHKDNPFERSQLSATCRLLVTGRAKCDVCGAELWPRYMETHMKRHLSSSSFVCADCPRTFSSAQDLKAHNELHNNVQVVCPECGQGFRSRAVFRVHRARTHRVCHKQSTTNQQRTSKCVHCHKQLHASSIARHIRTNHSIKQAVECGVCGLNLAHEDALREHSQSHYQGNTFTCPLCAQPCRNRAALRYHKLKCLKTAPIGRSEKECKETEDAPLIIDL